MKISLYIFSILFLFACAEKQNNTAETEIEAFDDEYNEPSVTGDEFAGEYTEEDYNFGGEYFFDENNVVITPGHMVFVATFDYGDTAYLFFKENVDDKAVFVCDPAYSSMNDSVVFVMDEDYTLGEIQFFYDSGDVSKEILVKYPSHFHR